MNRWTRTYQALGLVGVLLLSALILGAVEPTSERIAATGTATMNAAFTKVLASNARYSVLLDNRTATHPVYFLLNDSETTPTASATLYDFVLDSNESVIVPEAVLDAHPVRTVGCFCASTTPTVNVVGF